VNEGKSNVATKLPTLTLRTNPRRAKRKKKATRRHVTKYILEFVQRTRKHRRLAYWTGSKFTENKHKAKRFTSKDEAEKSARSLFRAQVLAYDGANVIAV
jgi:hypothetical protein